MSLQDKNINPFMDFGFKNPFGSEPNKDLLIDFLNQVLPGRHKIKDLTYAQTEGKEERNTEIARQMKAKSMDVKLISEITGLTIDEIENL